MGRWIAAVGILIVGVVAINAIYVAAPAYIGKNEDPRNSSVTMIAHLRWGIDPNTVVIDLIDLQPEASMADVTRCLLDIAQALKQKTFGSAELAFRGKAKFRMAGNYFRQLGDERSWQNPVYTIRTMAENIQTLDGKPAFGVLTGGWLAVTQRQVEAHNELHHRWYLTELFDH